MINIRQKELPGLALSLVLHLVILVPLAFISAGGQIDDLKIAVETIFSEERPTEEFTRELNTDTAIAETTNIVAGAAVASNAASGGSGAPAVAQQRIEESQQFKDPTIALNMSSVSLPGLNELGMDLGEGEIDGEVTAPVEGYGAALGRITQELMRLMREDRVLVVWLFDESESMKDDQAEIREQFHKVYEELGLAQERDEKLRAGQETLLTAIHSFGKSINALTPKPTSDIPEIRSAIDKIGIDQSGKEHMCAAINSVLDQYRSMAVKTKRKLAIILVSDESGDDGEAIDETIIKCRRANAPVYILGREAVFGYPWARIRWTDPQYGLPHWLQINRGPETPFPEALQFDGLHTRWDAQNSGFGPYEQARLAKETGGIFFVLPSEEENLTVRDAIERRKFQFLDLKEYVPDLSSRRDYEESRNKSKFRSTIWDIVVMLNPHKDKELNIREHHYSIDLAEFQKEGKLNFGRALRAMAMLNQATQILEKVKPLRDKEESSRWRANYDLILAQTLAYRVRLFQYLLALDAHAKANPRLVNPKNNEWNLVRTPPMLVPDAAQIKATKIDQEELKRQEQQARELLQFVRDTHPNTPWARRAEYELRQGFGMKFVEGFRDPRYKGLNIKVPSF